MIRKNSKPSIYQAAALDRYPHPKGITPIHPIPPQDTLEMCHLSSGAPKKILLCWADSSGLWRPCQMRKSWKSLVNDRKICKKQQSTNQTNTKTQWQAMENTNFISFISKPQGILPQTSLRTVECRSMFLSAILNLSLPVFQRSHLTFQHYLKVWI